METGKLQDAVSKASSSLYANHVNGSYVKTLVQMLQVKQRIKLYLKLWKRINQTLTIITFLYVRRPHGMAKHEHQTFPSFNKIPISTPETANNKHQLQFWTMLKRQIYILFTSLSYDFCFSFSLNSLFLSLSKLVVSLSISFPYSFLFLKTLNFSL